MAAVGEENGPTDVWGRTVCDPAGSELLGLCVTREGESITF